MFSDGESKDHDYIARVKVKQVNGKNKFRYFYTVDEYNAYLKGSKTKAEESVIKKSSNKTSNTNVSKEYIEELKNNSRKSSSSKESKKSGKEISESGKDFIEKLKKSSDKPYDEGDADENLSKTIKDLKKDLVKCGDGARGYIELEDYVGSGELDGITSAVWEVENGKVIIRDFRNNKKIDISKLTKAKDSEIADNFRYADKIKYFRTDNLEIRDNIRKAVNNR